MKMLVACEESDTVRGYFERLGWDAWSCDLQPTRNSNNKKHIQGDAIDLAYDRSRKWNLMVCHPPCTHLSLSGNASRKQKEIDGLVNPAIAFAQILFDAPINHVCLENPASILSTRWKKFSQSIQPWQFGCGEVKTTWLWLKNLPLLKPTIIVSGRVPRVHLLPPGPDRAKLRSTTYPEIAQAMATQWTQFYKNEMLVKKLNYKTT